MPKSGLGLLRDQGLPKRDPSGSSAVNNTCRNMVVLTQSFTPRELTPFGAMVRRLVKSPRRKIWRKSRKP